MWNKSSDRCGVSTNDAFTIYDELDRQRSALFSADVRFILKKDLKTLVH